MCDELAQEKSENIKVFIRVRLPEYPETFSNISIVNGQSIKISKSNDEKDSKTFNFNKVFGQDTTQLEIYKIVASPLVNQALTGFNGTIIAYGQSGTGKTFTILGDIKNTSLRGIVPNIFSHIFTQISIADCNTSYLITVTYLEIYNEEVRDLLNASGKKLEVRESPELGIYVKNLSGETIQSAEQVYEIISRGAQNRAVGCTNLNNQSSRSHAIFSILIEAKHEDGSTTFGKLNLVDLAGSERVSKSLATGERFKEAVKINLSLSVLGNVISALVDKDDAHIPYRNSKLTRLLQDSLGGSCLTSMIATISCDKQHLEETSCTLMYADRAKKIRNNVKKNEENNSILKSFEKQIRALQNQLASLDGKQCVNINGKKNQLKAENYRKKQDFEILATEGLKSKLLAQISALQQKILFGGRSLLEKAQLQMELLDYSTKQLEMLDNSERLLLESLQTKEQEKYCFERKSLSLQEQDKLLDVRIEEVERKITKAKNILFRNEYEYQNEISHLLYVNKNLAEDIGLVDFVIRNTIPKNQYSKIKDNTWFDEDSQECRLNAIAHCGNNLKKISLDIGKGPRVKTAIKSRYRKYLNEK